MAKLARLMQAGPPQFIDPAPLADAGDAISGELNIDDMQRLQEVLRRNSASLQFHLQFERDEQGRVHISGDYSTSLGVECRRCLQPLDVAITRTLNITLVADEDEARLLPRESEPLVLSGREMSLPIFFEDELLLALPLAPYHDTPSCHTQPVDNGQEIETRHQPFKVLKDLKLRKSTD